jgi:hypothetical protein
MQSWQRVKIATRRRFGFRSFPSRLLALAGLSLTALLFASAPDHPSPGELPSATEDHVAAEGWWPTKSLASRQAFLGSATCGECHSPIASTQDKTEMARAAFRASAQDAGQPAQGIFQSGPYRYRFIPSRAPLGYSLEVSSGGQSLSAPVIWTMGAGTHGQTYLLDENGALEEGQVSSFSFIHRLDLTPGHHAADAGSLDGAIGVPLNTGEALRCFACHTTASSANSLLDTAGAVPGIHCEACHGPGLEHVNAIKSGNVAQARKAIFNPASLSPTDSIDFCGSCHRTTMDVILHASAIGVDTIRYQPYRLEESRCWQTTRDARLACTSCHDPHTPLVRSASFYDQKCLSCHRPRKQAMDAAAHAWAATPKVCPRATENCVSCHMQKSNVPEMHSAFTDHFIRVVRSGEPIPN